MENIKTEIELLMLPEMDSIIAYWNTYGQIYENQFAFARHDIMKNHAKLAYDIMTEHGAYIFRFAEDDETDEFAVNGHFHVRRSPTTNEGWMWTFCSIAMVDFNDVDKNVIDYYNAHPTFPSP